MFCSYGKKKNNNTKFEMQMIKLCRSHGVMWAAPVNLPYNIISKPKPKYKDQLDNI